MAGLTLREIAEKYRPFGIQKGVEFLLPPDKMTQMIDDLAQSDVLILGCDLWRYVDREKNWIVQLVGVGYDIGEANPTARDAATMIKQFLSTKLPGDAEMVSLLWADLSVYACFK